MKKQNISDERGIVYIIYNSIPPYAFETNNILTPPNGLTYRARFQKKYCPTISDNNQINGCNGLIILRNWDSSELIPLRRIKIFNVDPGRDLYIDYVLQDIVEFDTNAEIANSQLKSFNEKMTLELKPFSNIPKTDLTKLVFFGPDLTIGINDSNYKGTPQEKDFDNWNKIINLLENNERFLDIDFLKIIKIVDVKGQSKGFIKSNGITRYNLENNKVYYATIYQRSKTNLKGDSSVTRREITLNGENDVIKPIKNRYGVSGKYDKYQFRFKPQITQTSRDSELSLEINRSDDKGPIPTVFLPIRITNPIFSQIYQIIFLLFFLLGSTMLFFSDYFFTNNVTLSQNCGVFLMIISGDETRKLIVNIVDRIKFGLNIN